MNPDCAFCKQPLDDEELERGCHDGCALDAWERQRDAREQAYLEDDRNWP